MDCDRSDAQSSQRLGRYLSKLNPMNLNQRSQRGKALLALAAVCFFWGTTWIASKEGVRHMPALQLAGIRQFLGGSCYLIFFLVFKKSALPKGKEWGPIIILSVLNFMLSNALSTWGVQYISAGLGSIIGAIFPLWLVIIGFFGSTSRMSPKTALGLALGFAGICVVFWDHLSEFLDPRFRFGITLSILSTWTWAFGTLYTKKQATAFNPYLSLGLQMAISGVTLFTGMHLAGTAVPLSAIPAASWWAILYLVVFGSVISFIAYLYALQHLPTHQVSIYAYINPIVAVLLGWMLFNEKFSAAILLGTTISLYGIYLVNTARQKQ